MIASIRRTAQAAAVAALLASCGSGFVAIFSDQGSSSAGPPRVPTLAGNQQLAPLLHEEITLWEAKIENYELPSRLDRIAVEIRALGVVDGQQLVRQLNATTIQFLYSTATIRSRAVAVHGPDVLRERDIEATLAMLVDGVEVADPAPLRLLHQPLAEIENAPAFKTLSPFGETLELHLREISLRLPADLRPGEPGYTAQLVQLNTLRPRIAFGRALEDQTTVEIVQAMPAASGELRLSVAMPAVDLPSQAHVTISTLPSGLSTLVSNMFYRPQVLSASPATGPAGGGTTIVLFGRALVPSIENSEELDFDQVAITIRKGGRETGIPVSQVQKELSTSSRLVFSMPAAPDGRPGPADVRLRVTVPSLSGDPFVIETETIGVFSYGDSQPYFGPRGAHLGEVPAVVRFAPFVEPKRRAVDAISVTSGPAGMPFASVYSSRGNGLFSRFGQPVRAGVVSDVFQRGPVDFCIADYIGDGTRSGVIINSGPALTLLARHGFVVGSNSNPPLVFDEDFRLDYENPGRACATGDLNNDGVSDLVIISGPGQRTSNPSILVFTSSGQPTPRFTRTIVTSSDPESLDFEAVALDDIDNDGMLDLVVAQGGSKPRLIVAFGDGRGGFPEVDRLDLKGATLDLAAVGYIPNDASRVVGVHPVGPVLERSLVMVMSGVSGSTEAPPAVLHIERGSGPREFVAPRSAGVLRFAGGARVFVASAAGDLTGDDSAELAVAAAADDNDPVRIFLRTSASELVFEETGIQYGAERIEAPRAVAIGVGAAPGQHHQVEGRPAVFVTHDQTLRSGIEHRVSTMLAVPGLPRPRLLSSVGARRLSEPIRGVTLGSFFPRQPLGTGEYGDAWIAVQDGLIAARNDGVGELEVQPDTVSAAQLIGTTLTTIRTRLGADPPVIGEVPAFLTANGRLGLVLPAASHTVRYAGDSNPVDLRSFAPADPDPQKNLQLRDLRANSLIRSADIDLDGIPDLVVALGLAQTVGLGLEGEVLLLLLRGKANPAPGGFPFELPSGNGTTRSVTHGNASAVVVGDFVTTTSTPNMLELAVALPRGGSLQNEVRFYRWDLAERRFVQSFTSANNPALPVGNEPAGMVADDYNGDGRTDIAVASRADRNLWVIYNVSSPTPGPDVDLSRFESAPANPLALPGGEPQQMFSDDLNGDGLPDVTLLIETGTLLREYEVVYYLSPGSLSGSVIRAVPSERTGSLVRTAGSWLPRNAPARAALRDLNGDGEPDLVVGWATAGAGDYNLRVLFGNNL